MAKLLPAIVKELKDDIEDGRFPGAIKFIARNEYDMLTEDEAAALECDKCSQVAKLYRD